MEQKLDCNDTMDLIGSLNQRLDALEEKLIGTERAALKSSRNKQVWVCFTKPR